MDFKRDLFDVLLQLLEQEIFNISDEEITKTIRTGLKQWIEAERWARENVESAEENPKFESNLPLAQKYKAKIISELIWKCTEIITALKFALSFATTQDSKVVYTKLIADFYRYIADWGEDPRFETPKMLSGDYFKQAYAMLDDLDKTNDNLAIRGSVALNYSIFLVDHMGEFDEGIRVALDALDEINSELESSTEPPTKEIQIVKDYLTENIKEYTEDRDKT